jgi:L-rhamnose mutarotase
MQRHVYALDLADDPGLIAEYESWHRAGKIWPEILDSLRPWAFHSLDIFRTGNRLVLIIEAPDDFSPEAKAQADAGNPAVQAWERLMWTFQRALPWAKPEQKWVPMERIFSLNEVIGQ